MIVGIDVAVVVTLADAVMVGARVGKRKTWGERLQLVR